MRLPDLREHLHDRLDFLAVLSPVASDIVAALPRALADLVTSDAGVDLRRRPTRSGGWGTYAERDRAELRAAAAACCVVHPDGLSPTEVGLAAHRAGYPGLPLTVHVSGSLVAVMLPHDLFDGSSGWEQVERLFQHAAGVEPRPLRPRQRWPVLASMRKAGLTSRAALVEVRQIRRHSETSTETAPVTDTDVVPDEARRRDGLHTVYLTDAQLARLSTPARSEDLIASTLVAAVLDKPSRSRRTTLTMRLNSLVVEAAREIVPADRDLRVRMAIDLRRYAPKGHRVDGPFSMTYPLGTLRTIDADPGALGSNAFSAISSSAPLAGLVADLVGYCKTRVRHPRGLPAPPPGRRSFDLVVSTLPARLPAGFWSGHGARVMAALLFHPVQATDPYVQVALVEGGVVVALWDEAGVTDGAAFPKAFAAVMDARYPRT